jgi:hypothetical protein
LSPTLATKADDWSALAKQAMPSVVSIKVYNADNKHVQSGTGFAISENQIITCWHCIPNGVGSIKAMTKSGKTLDVETILAYSAINDLVLLGYSGESLPSLELVRVAPEAGSPAVVIGCPRTFEFSITDGIVSSWRSNSDFENRQEVQYTAPSSPGNSGGPIFSKDGKVMGVVSWGRVDRGSQNLNFGISYVHVQDLIEESKASKPIKLSDTQSTSSLKSESKDDTDAIDAFYDQIIEGYLEDKDYKRLLEIEEIKIEQRNTNDRARRRELGKRRDALMSRKAGYEPKVNPIDTAIGKIGELETGFGAGATREYFMLKLRISETDSLVTLQTDDRVIDRILVQGAATNNVVVGDAVVFNGIYMYLGVVNYQLPNGDTLRLRAFSALDIDELREAEERLTPFDHNMIRQRALMRIR